MTVFIAAPGTETLPVRMFLYIQDNIDPLVTSVSAAVIALTTILLIVLDRALRPRPAADRAGQRGGMMPRLQDARFRCRRDRRRPGRLGARLGPRAGRPARGGARRGRCRRIAPRAATSRWCGCRARASACRRTRAGPCARPTPGPASPPRSRRRPASTSRYRAAGRLPSRALRARATRAAPVACCSACTISPASTGYRLRDARPRRASKRRLPAHRARGRRRQLLRARRPLQFAAAAPRAASPACSNCGVTLPAGHRVETHRVHRRRSSACATPHGEIRAGKVVLAAGIGNARLGADGRPGRAGAAAARPDHRHRARSRRSCATRSPRCARPTKAA